MKSTSLFLFALLLSSCAVNQAPTRPQGKALALIDFQMQETSPYKLVFQREEKTYDLIASCKQRCPSLKALFAEELPTGNYQLVSLFKNEQHKWIRVPHPSFSFSLSEEKTYYLGVWTLKNNQWNFTQDTSRLYNQWPGLKETPPTTLLPFESF